MKKRIALMLNPEWGLLASDVLWMNARWSTYKDLFCSGQKRLDLLNRTAGTFFRLIQSVLLNDIVLSLCRLTDPCETMSQRNLVLEHLLKRPEVQRDRSLVGILESHLATLKTMCDPLRRLRHKRIAHRDLHIALKVARNPLPGLSFATIEDALTEVCSFMNAIESSLANAQTAYSLVQVDQGANAILGAVKRAAAYKKAEEDGVIDPEFFWKTPGVNA